MKKVLIAVDGTKGSKAIFSVFSNLVRPPQNVILLHVEKPGGKSAMYDMLGEAEMSTFKEMIEGTEFKNKMDERAQMILAYYRKELENGGLVSIKTMTRVGHPSEEILKAAEEEGVDLVILGCNGKKGLHKFLKGCVTKEVERSARMPVLIAKNQGCEKAVVCEEASEAYAAG